MNRLTSRRTIQHSDGTSHIETYCFGHRYGPAAFPQKWGSGYPKDYEEYCMMIDRLAAYEDSGLSPEQVQELAQAKGKDVVCHCNIKKNAELIAEILDYDVENEIAISLSLEEMKTYINAYEDYRELKEQGRLIVLPCQIGQKAWYIKDGNIDYGFARWFEESDGKWYASVQNEPKSMLFFEFDDFGKTIFLTRKAAEEALRKEQSYE